MRSLEDICTRVSEVGLPFWQGLREGRIELPYCNRCDRAFFYPRRHCPHCSTTDVGWIRASGRGTVWSFTRLHVTLPGVDEADLPLVAALIDLDEGVRIPGRFASEATPAVGQRVALSVDRLDGFPIFAAEAPTS